MLRTCRGVVIMRLLATLQPRFGLPLCSRVRGFQSIPYTKMSIGVPKESMALERRVAQTPETVKRLTKEGFTVHVESGAGAASSFSDEAYRYFSLPRKFYVSNPNFPSEMSIAHGLPNHRLS